MIIERTENEVILRLPNDIGALGLDNITRYLKYLESVRNSKSTELQANKLAKESKKAGGLRTSINTLNEFCC